MRGVVFGSLLLLLFGCPRELTPGSCGECHTLASSKNHMLTNGGKFDDARGRWKEPSPAEICSRCHAPGKTMDVDVAHAKSPRYHE
jgi:hypothetical protein